MINYKEFERKVYSMSAHDIIMAMVNGLRNPKTRIDMSTFGSIREDICYGCAATNTILNIMDANEEQVKSYVPYRQKYGNSLLYGFERAIDLLRRGRAIAYNRYATLLDFAQIIPMPDQELPHLSNYYTEQQLKEYEKLAKYQLTI